MFIGQSPTNQATRDVLYVSEYDDQKKSLFQFQITGLKLSAKCLFFSQ